MIPVDQTVYGGEAGNCLAACIASLLHLEIEAVPNVCEGGDGWFDRLTAWLLPRGMVPLCFKGPPLPQLGAALCIVSGASPRGDFLHATVYRGDALVHDPHFSRAGIGEVADTMYLIPLDPMEPPR